MGSLSASRSFVVSALLAVAAFSPRAHAADGGAQPPRILGAPAGKPTAAKPKPTAGKPPRVAKANAKPKQPKKPKTTNVVLYHLNRHDTLVLHQKDFQGRPPKGFQKRFDRFLRCHYTNTQHAMNPRLERLLYQTGRHWPGQRIEVISGFRSPSVAKNPHSPHMKGLACDFRVVGVKNTELRDYLRKNMKKVGVGYYPNSSFVHLDVRKDRSAFWIDYSGPGERANYAQNPGEDLKSGRAESYHPTKISDDWVNDTPTTTGAEDESESKRAAPADEAGMPSAATRPSALAGRPSPPSQSATP